MKMLLPVQNVTGTWPRAIRKSNYRLPRAAPRAARAGTQERHRLAALPRAQAAGARDGAAALGPAHRGHAVQQHLTAAAALGGPHVAESNAVLLLSRHLS